MLFESPQERLRSIGTFTSLAPCPATATQYLLLVFASKPPIAFPITICHVLSATNHCLENVGSFCAIRHHCYDISVGSVLGFIVDTEVHPSGAGPLGVHSLRTLSMYLGPSFDGLYAPLSYIGSLGGRTICSAVDVLLYIDCFISASLPGKSG